MDTARYILTAIMGVSGSILGFLVIYLSFAFEGIRRFFGRYSNTIFRRDRFIWSMCWFFSGIILVCLGALCLVDHPGPFWRFLINLSCFAFLIAIGTIVLFGKMILRKSDTVEEIRRQIERITLLDFRTEPASGWEFGPSHWIITEDRNNPIDRLTGILLHNIIEKNNSVVANMLRSICQRIEDLVRAEAEGDKERAVLRYNDVLLLAFDQAKGQNDPLVFKLIFSNYRNLSDLLANSQMGRRVIEPVLKSAKSTVQYWVEMENEQLVHDGFLTYNQMCYSQIQHNLPVESETWQRNQKGDMAKIESPQADSNYERMMGIFLASTFEYNSLVERSLESKNAAIPEIALRMMGAFLEQLIVVNIPSEYERLQIGRKLSYHAVMIGKQYSDKFKSTRFGFLRLFVTESPMDTLLQKDTELTLIVFGHFEQFARFLIENDLFHRMDLDLIGNIGRRIARNSETFPSALSAMTVLVALNRAARRKLMVSLVDKSTGRDNLEVPRRIRSLDRDLESWLKNEAESAHPNDSIRTLLKVNQWLPT